MIHVDPARVAASPAPAPAEGGAPGDARAVAEGRIAMLTRLAEVGMAIVEAAGRQAADAAGEPAALRDAGLTYARVARAVRMTLALQARLAADLVALDAAAATAEVGRRNVQRVRLERLAHLALAAEPELDSHEIRRLAAHARERLYDAREDAAVLDLPFPQVIACICADLGLSPDWTARMVELAERGEPAAGGPDAGAPDDARDRPAAPPGGAAVASILEAGRPPPLPWREPAPDG